MTKAKVMIQASHASILQDDQIVLLGDALIRRWRIPTNQSVSLRFGTTKQQIKVVCAPRSDSLRISPSLMNKLGIDPDGQLYIHYNPVAHSLAVGPLIGVLVSRVYSGSPDRPFGSITAWCKEVVDACRLHGASVFFFSPKEIVAGSRRISGWSYSGRWKKRDFPIPDVVHNRLTSRRLENMPRVQQFFKEVKSRHNMAVFNEKYLNKTEVFQALRKDASSLKYLPESHTFKSFTLLKSMCGKYTTVFLKPVYGSLGNGIIRITRQSDHSYACHYSTVNGSRLQNHESISKLFSAISGKMRRSRYQIQQGIALMQAGGRPVDFRALVQKNGSGEWSITSIVARIAGNNHFVSNVARGGVLSTVKGALQRSNLNPADRKNVREDLEKAALEIAKGIETHISNHFGELGVDLAVDGHGKVWLLEVNSKPSKNDNTALTKRKIRPSVVQLVHYARFLSGFER